MPVDFGWEDGPPSNKGYCDDERTAEQMKATVPTNANWKSIALVLLSEQLNMLRSLVVRRAPPTSL
jgi:hypothetical protein